MPSGSRATAAEAVLQVGGIALGCAMAVGFALPLITAKHSSADFTDRVVLVALLTGAGLLSAPAWVRRVTLAQAVATAGAVLWTLVPFAGDVRWGWTLPGLLLPWVALLWAVRPAGRLTLLVLQYFSLVGFLQATVGTSEASNVALAVGSVHLVLVWLTTPEPALRRVILALGAVSAALVGGFALGGLTQTLANATGRLGLATTAILFTAALVVLAVHPRLRDRHVPPPLGAPRPLAGRWLQAKPPLPPA